MIHIQRSISHFVCSVTDSINKSKKISKREIENLKLQDLGRQPKGSSEEKESEEGEEPDADTLASELSSTSVHFIEDMGFRALASKLQGRFQEIKESWKRPETLSKSSQTEANSWREAQNYFRVKTFQDIFAIKQEYSTADKERREREYIDDVKKLCSKLEPTAENSVSFLTLPDAFHLSWSNLTFHGIKALRIEGDIVQIYKQVVSMFGSSSENLQKDDADFTLEVVTQRLLDPTDFEIPL